MNKEEKMKIERIKINNMSMGTEFFDNFIQFFIDYHKYILYHFSCCQNSPSPLTKILRPH